MLFFFNHNDFFDGNLGLQFPFNVVLFEIITCTTMVKGFLCVCRTIETLRHPLKDSVASMLYISAGRNMSVSFHSISYSLIRECFIRYIIFFVFIVD